MEKPRFEQVSISKYVRICSSSKILPACFANIAALELSDIESIAEYWERVKPGFNNDLEFLRSTSRRLDSDALSDIVI